MEKANFSVFFAFPLVAVQLPEEVLEAFQTIIRFAILPDNTVADIILRFMKPSNLVADFVEAAHQILLICLADLFMLMEGTRRNG